VITLQSCGGDESEDSKKDDKPKTACECFEVYGKEIAKFVDMSDADFTKNAQAFQDLGLRIDKDSLFNKMFMEEQKKYKTGEEFEKVCPSFKKFMENANKVQARMMQNMTTVDATSEEL
jgi:hypothetical protein